MAAYYRDGWIDAATGLPITDDELIEMRDAFLGTVEAELRALVDELGDAEPEQFVTWPVWSVNRWAERLAEKVREIAIRAYAGIMGGSLSNIPAEGWEAIAGVLDRQDPFVADFIQDVRGGGLSKAQIAARSELYTAAATSAWERGVAQARRLDFPGYPAELCLGGGRCRCSWDIDETETEYRCYWRAAGDDQVCGPCTDASREWNPYTIEKKGAA